MYSPKIKEDLIPVLYKKAKDDKVPMTTFVDNLLRKALTIKTVCASCLKQLDVDDDQEEAFCESCETTVFIERRAV